MNKFLFGFGLFFIVLAGLFVILKDVVFEEFDLESLEELEKDVLEGFSSDQIDDSFSLAKYIFEVPKYMLIIGCIIILLSFFKN